MSESEITETATDRGGSPSLHEENPSLLEPHESPSTLLENPSPYESPLESLSTLLEENPSLYESPSTLLEENPSALLVNPFFLFESLFIFLLEENPFLLESLFSPFVNPFTLSENPSTLHENPTFLLLEACEKSAIVTEAQKGSHLLEISGAMPITNDIGTGGGLTDINRVIPEPTATKSGINLPWPRMSHSSTPRPLWPQWLCTPRTR